MKTTGLLLSLILILKFTVAQADVGAQFRGYTEINRLVHERIAAPNGFEVGRYLGETTPEPSTNGLLQLLGTYLGSDTDAEFRNGDPNSLNMILWYIALTGLAKDIAAYCNPAHPTPVASQLQLAPEFLAALQPICAWPSQSAQDDTVMMAYWTALLSFDAPEEEFEAWRDYFTSDSAYVKASAAQAVAAMTLAALYNPYFILRN